MKKEIDFVQKNKDAYNRIVEPFAGTRAYVWDDLLPLRQYTKDGDRVLDVGCGVGRLYQLFDDLSIVYTGIDQSDGQIAEAKKQYPQGKFILGGMADLPFADQFFDSVYCIATLHHLPTHEDRIRALREMKRVVVPGGYIILTNWNLKSDYAKKKMKEKKWYVGNTPDHIIIPWREGSGAALAERHYWMLDISMLAEESGLLLVEHYFSTKGRETDEARGDNIVAILRA
jgi:ubiquinone/menaquinone biosynthesis C-methylase UbiE